MTPVGTAPAASPAASPAARRVATPRWLDLRLVLGVVLVLGSVLVGARIVSSAGDTYEVAAAARDLGAGYRLTAADVRMTKVQLPDHGHGVYVQTSKAAIGQTLRHDVTKGELLADSALGATSPHTTITLTVASGAAPDLRSGERIAVWLSTPLCASVVLLPDVAVQSVRHDDSGTFDSGTDGQNVVVDVGSSTAQRVNAALSSENATLRAGVLSGPQPSSQQSLPDLSTCLASK